MLVLSNARTYHNNLVSLKDFFKLFLLSHFSVDNLFFGFVFVSHCVYFGAVWLVVFRLLMQMGKKKGTGPHDNKIFFYGQNLGEVRNLTLEG